MNKSLCIASALFLLLQSGCANNRFPFQPIMDSTQSPEPASGYVAGMFSRDWNPSKLGFGLVIVNTATAEEYVMPFGVEAVLPEKVIDEFGMIQLPPGEYRIAHWLTYSTEDYGQLTRIAMPPDSMAAAPFVLAPGSVVFVGSYVARNRQNNGSNGGNPWSVHHQRLTLQTVRKGLSNRYPLFSTQPMLCPSCIE
ncbi:MAG: hypothetical protein HZB47_14730 [Nitrosomonadales bacterium]|nr:hypothetical protein [Nitrosomonadales bacterium]